MPRAKHVSVSPLKRKQCACAMSLRHYENGAKIEVLLSSKPCPSSSSPLPCRRQFRHGSKTVPGHERDQRRQFPHGENVSSRVWSAHGGAGILSVLDASSDRTSLKFVFLQINIYLYIADIYLFITDNVVNQYEKQFQL